MGSVSILCLSAPCGKYYERQQHSSWSSWNIKVPFCAYQLAVFGGAYDGGRIRCGKRAGNFCVFCSGAIAIVILKYFPSCSEISRHLQDHPLGAWWCEPDSQVILWMVNEVNEQAEFVETNYCIYQQVLRSLQWITINKQNCHIMVVFYWTLFEGQGNLNINIFLNIYVKDIKGIPFEKLYLRHFLKVLLNCESYSIHISFWILNVNGCAVRKECHLFHTCCLENGLNNAVTYSQFLSLVPC